MVSKLIRVVPRPGGGEPQWLELRPGQQVAELVQTLPKRKGFEWIVVEASDEDAPARIIEAPKERWG